MVNPIEIIGSILFLLFAGWVIYQTKIKPKQQQIKPETPETPAKEKNFLTKIYKKFKGGAIGKIKLSNIVIVLALLTLLFWDSFHTTTYTFSAKENLPDNWKVTSGNGNLKVEDGCLIISGPVSMILKDGDKIDYTEIKVTPCDGESFSDISVIGGDLAFRYYYGPDPNGKYPGIYQVGTIDIISKGKRVSSFFPNPGNSQKNDKARTFVIQRGNFVWPNYELKAVGSGGSIFDRIDLAGAYYPDDAGMGKIGIKTGTGGEKIKNIVIEEGLKRKFKSLFSWV